MTALPILRRILLYGSILGLAIAIIGAIAGLVADGSRGLVSALIGAVMAFVFLGVTSASIVLATRLTRGDFLNPAFFGIVLGGWIVKFVVFLVLLILLRDQAWINTVVLFLAIVTSVIGSLVIDVVVIARSRQPYVDVTLPAAPTGEADV